MVIRKKLNVNHIIWFTFFQFYAKIAISLFILFLFNGCTKEIKLDFNKCEKRLVINSIFTPDNTFSFHFSHSIASVDRYDTTTIENLHVILYENKIAVLDTFLLSDSLITGIVPKINTHYSLEVISDEYPAIIANDSIPELVEIQQATIIIPAGTDRYGDYYAEACISFSDPPDDSNYYELLICSSYPQGSNQTYWLCMGDCEIVDPVLINEGDVDYLPTSYFFSDALFNGEKYTMKIRSAGGDYGQNKINKAVLRSVSKNYYLYRKYYTRHSYNQQFQGDFLDIIFMGEPQSMFTNIVNGYGIFAGYQETTRDLLQID